MARNPTALRIAASCIALAVLGACSIDSPTSPKAVLPPATRALALDAGTETGTYLVKYLTTGAVSTLRTSVQAVGGTVKRQISDMGLLYVDGLSAQGAAALASQPGVTLTKDRLMQFVPKPNTVKRNLIVRAGTANAQGTDQRRALFLEPFQWNMTVINAHRTWVPSNGGKGETVCVLDTGVDPGHLDLAGTVDPTKLETLILVPRFASDATPLDYNFHGTFVSALVRSNGIAMASVAPNATLCSLKVLSEDGVGSFGDIIYAIFAATRFFGADVINLSLGAYIDASQPANAPFLALLQDVIGAARNSGVLVVAAAGNDGLNMDDISRLFGVIHIPSMMQGVISVGATGPYQQQNFDQLAGYSNFGGERGGLDLVAPGGNGGLPGGFTADFVISACSQFAFGGGCAGGSFYVFANGTSGAAPHVAGAGAVVESNVGSMSTAQLEQCLLSTAKVLLPAWIYGKGRVDVRKASLCTGK